MLAHLKSSEFGVHWLVIFLVHVKIMRRWGYCLQTQTHYFVITIWENFHIRDEFLMKRIGSPKMIIRMFFSSSAIVASRWYALLEKRPPLGIGWCGEGAKGGTKLVHSVVTFFQKGLPKYNQNQKHKKWQMYFVSLRFCRQCLDCTVRVCSIVEIFWHFHFLARLFCAIADYWIISSLWLWACMQKLYLMKGF